MISPIPLGLMALGMTAVGFILLMFARKSATKHAPARQTNTKTESESSPEASQASLTHCFFRTLLKHPDKWQSDRKFLFADFGSDWPDYLDDPSLFPRQPMVLPKLLQAMKSEQSNNQALLKIVLEDPGLTTEVLRLANSPIYRNTTKEIQSLDYALVMLGLDGLHSLVCSSLMKPIFAKRRGDGFSASLFWDWAIASSQAAQHFASLNQIKAPTQVYMLSLLTRLSELVILRLCTRLAEKSGTVNSAAVVLPIVEHYRHAVTARLIDEWGFDPGWSKRLPRRADLDPQAPDYQIFRAQRLAIEFGSANILLKKKLISQEDAINRFQSLGVAQITARHVLTRL